MSEAEKIAAGLTEAQRYCVLDHRPTRGTPQKGWPESAHDPRSWSMAGRHLRGLGLVTWANGHDSHTRLTPLGLEVRVILSRSNTGRDSDG